MDFDKIIIAIAGWAIGFFQSARSARKSEVNKLKDRLVDKLEKIQAYCIEEVKKTDYMPLDLEEHISMKVSGIELRIRQINQYIGCEIFSINNLLSLRNIDLFVDMEGKPILIRQLNEMFSDIIESIETSHDDYYVSKGALYRLWSGWRAELLGAALGLTCMLLFFGLMRLFFSLF